MSGSSNDDEIVLVLDSEDHDLIAKELSSAMRPPAKGWSRLFSWKCSHVQCDARPWSTGTLFCRAVKRPLYAVAFILYVYPDYRSRVRLIVYSCLATVISFTASNLLSFLAEARDAAVFLRNRPSLFSDWFTHGVIPVPCHSHNDYWRHVPLYSALTAGCVSVEADVWSEGDDLLVGHTRQTVLDGHTLQSLYLTPLFEMLQKHDPRNMNRTVEANSPVGIFASDLSQTLVLLVDFKADPQSIWRLLMEQLQPFRENGYLSYFDGSAVIQRAITVVATGDVPFDRILENTTYHDVFFDAPLDKLVFSDSSTEPDASIYNVTNSYYASVDFRTSIGSLPTGRLSYAQLTKLRSQIDIAHERGLKVRYWGTPTWPVGLRNYVWRVLVREGVDVLNVDDLHGATKVDWTSRSWWP